MARTDTLGNFLKDVADAIRTAEGSSGTIQASTFDTRIEALPGGGGSSYAPQYILFSNFGGEDLSYEVSHLDTSNMEKMNYMFSYCNGLTELDVSNFNTSNVTEMTNMFEYCTASSINVSGFDTSNVLMMDSMFLACPNLTSLDLSSFTTTNLSSCSAMFSDCSSLEFLDIRNFDFSNIAEYSEMFTNVDTNCEIIVADSTQKDWMATNFPEMENVKTVAEYEA